MANVHAENFRKDPGCRLVAACDVDPGRARAFAEKHDIPESFSSTEALLAGAEFDAVTIVTPDAFHAPVALLCLKAGKHVLCEKPLALNHADAKKMAAAAKRAGVVNMVNFSYRDRPCIQAAARLIQRGQIGEVRHVEASYLQAWLPSKVWGDWRKNPAWLCGCLPRTAAKARWAMSGCILSITPPFPAGRSRKSFAGCARFPRRPATGWGNTPSTPTTRPSSMSSSPTGPLARSTPAGGSAATPTGLPSKSREPRARFFWIRTFPPPRSKCATAGGSTNPNGARSPASRFRQTTSGSSRRSAPGLPAKPTSPAGPACRRFLDACFESDKKKRPVRL